MSASDLVAAGVLAELSGRAGAADAEATWPAESWKLLLDCGTLRWIIPREHGGIDRGSLELLRCYESLASACLTACFLLSQREAAIRRLRDSGKDALCRELLPPLARGERFATVGLSQLTTSRQHLSPSLTTRDLGDGLLLDGSIPWVTGASRADHLVIGAVLDDSRQVLAVLPRDLPGVEIGQTLDLMALRGSLTAEVRCRQVRLEKRWLLAGPAERVLAAGRGGSGGLDTSCLALGLAGSAIDYLHGEAVARPELHERTSRLEDGRRRVRHELHRLAAEGATADAAAVLRAQANALVLRATQTALTAAKGAGFLRGHPAQRWARQALFFLVWSCPRPAMEATLDCLTS